MAAPQLQKVHKDPRISVNKLAEYLSTSKAARREKILQDAKFPPTYQLIRYDPTKQMIQLYLSGKIPNTQALQQEIDKYGLTKTSNDFEERMKKSNAEALSIFLKFAPTLSFGDSIISLGENAPPKLNINDVAISVRPELLLSTSKKGATSRGAIKLNISKGAVHTLGSAEFAGTLVRHFLTSQHGPDVCDHKTCFTLDVFGKKLSETPKAITNRMKDVEAACGEIARQWDSIKAP